jgi:hypothetical protein
VNRIEEARYAAEPVDDLSSGKVFERKLALETFDWAMKELASESAGDHLALRRFPALWPAPEIAAANENRLRFLERICDVVELSIWIPVRRGSIEATPPLSAVS